MLQYSVGGKKSPKNPQKIPLNPPFAKGEAKGEIHGNHRFTHSITRRPKNQSGVALLMVVSSILILTMIITEFAYSVKVEHHMAALKQERLQAYYLALSAYNLVRLELKMGSSVQNQIASALSNADIAVSIDLSAPICQQLPIKTPVYRLIASGALKTEGEESGVEEEAGVLAAFPLQGVEEFLQFKGDFEGECVDESSKMNLNFFFDQDPDKETLGADNPYDDFKKLIIKILDQPKYKELFEEGEFTTTELVRNIADWIDPNDVINELGRSRGGGEESLYREVASGEFATKNGKLSTFKDIYQVAGVEDSWWAPVSELFTIYGPSAPGGRPAVNVCQASDEIVRAYVLRYAETRADLPPIKEEDEEIISDLVFTVKGGCGDSKPDKNQIAADLDKKLLELLKVETAPLEEGALPEEEIPPEGGAAGEKKTTSRFADSIATESRFYLLKLLGMVKDTTVRIETVIDVGEGGGTDTRKWKTLYWKIY